MKGLRVQRLKPDRGATKHTSGTSVLISHARTSRLRPRHIQAVHKVALLRDQLGVLEGRVEKARGVLEEVRTEAIKHMAAHPGDPRMDTSVAEQELRARMGEADDLRAALQIAQRALASRQAREPSTEELLKLEDELVAAMDGVNAAARLVLEAQSRLEGVRARALSTLGNTHQISDWPVVRLATARKDLGAWLAAEAIAPDVWLV